MSNNGSILRLRSGKYRASLLLQDETYIQVFTDLEAAIDWIIKGDKELNGNTTRRSEISMADELDVYQKAQQLGNSSFPELKIDLFDAYYSGYTNMPLRHLHDSIKVIYERAYMLGIYHRNVNKAPLLTDESIRSMLNYLEEQERSRLAR